MNFENYFLFPNRLSLSSLSLIPQNLARRLKYYYYLEFCKQDASIKGKFNAELNGVEELLKEFHNKQLDVNLLERMSRDFQLDYQKMLVSQVCEHSVNFKF